jgi:hypothetical protein
MTASAIITGSRPDCEFVAKRGKQSENVQARSALSSLPEFVPDLYKNGQNVRILGDRSIQLEKSCTTLVVIGTAVAERPA